MTLRPVPFGDREYLDPAALDALRAHGIEPLLVTESADLDALPADSGPGVVLLPVEAFSPEELGACVSRCSQLKLPVIALVRERDLDTMGTAPEADDFLVSPPGIAELVVRCKGVLKRTASSGSADAIDVGGLVINPTNYEVSLRGRRLNLRFKEYELLVLLATSPGRVYTRETILNRVWGYEYLGGTRTVDVHIRRLRSKIEDAGDRFIETVWNLGYRFKEFDGAS